MQVLVIKDVIRWQTDKMLFIDFEREKERMLKTKDPIKGLGT